MLIWAIINYIPLRQFEPGNIHICFYEDIYKDPNQEISKIFQYMRGAHGNCPVDLPKKVINRPSRSTRKFYQMKHEELTEKKDKAAEIRSIEQSTSFD